MFNKIYILLFDKRSMGFLSNFFGRVKIIENSGDSAENAIKIEGNSFRVMQAEHEYIKKKFGRSAKILSQSLTIAKDKTYDRFVIMSKGKRREVYFEVRR